MQGKAYVRGTGSMAIYNTLMQCSNLFLRKIQYLFSLQLHPTASTNLKAAFFHFWQYIIDCQTPVHEQSTRNLLTSMSTGCKVLLHLKLKNQHIKQTSLLETVSVSIAEPLQNRRHAQNP